MARGVDTRIEEKRSPVCDVASFMQTRGRESALYVVDDGLRL